MGETRDEVINTVSSFVLLMGFIFKRFPAKFIDGV